MKKCFCDKCKKEVSKELPSSVWNGRAVELCEECRAELDTIVTEWYNSWWFES